MNYVIIFLLLCLTATAQKKQLYIINGDNEYNTKTSLPRFAQQVLDKDFDVHLISSHPKDMHYLQGLENIRKADLVILSTWRLALEKSQLNLIKGYINSGKPIIAIRTVTHGFSLRKNTEGPKGTEQWPNFDQEILGCKYSGHEPADLLTNVTINSTNKKSLLLNKVRNYINRRGLKKLFGASHFFCIRGPRPEK